MANLRWKYDARDVPFAINNDDAGMPHHHTPDALLLNIGTTTYPAKTASSGNFVNVRGYATHTSGDVRSIYNRLYLYGAGGSGESLRAFTSVGTVAAATAHGAHISLNFSASTSSKLTGLGVAMRATLHLPDIASWNPGSGTLAAVQAEIYADGDESDPAGLTELSFIRIVSGGNSDGRADIDDDAYLMSIQGVTAEDGDTGTGSLLTTGCADIGLATNLTAALKIKIGSTDYWIPLATAIGGDGA